MTQINEQVFRFLEGDWAIRRRFEGNYGGSFSGKGRFTAEELADVPTYRYDEEGELKDAEGKHFDAKQSYRYSLEAGKLQVQKREDSGWVLMHELDFSDDGGMATASHLHLCGQDRYATEYRVDLTGTWEVNYTVAGPKKDYRIHSVFSPIPSTRG